MKHIILIAILTILAINATSQSRFSKHEISINGFRNPSIGLEYRYRVVSLINPTPGVSYSFFF